MIDGGTLIRIVIITLVADKTLVYMLEHFSQMAHWSNDQRVSLPIKMSRV